ncbi:hypothetical protein LCI18_010962 [Fusarium solani-melongenae]|uniref:Uncharacterized protein n=1 Tax=Fusarium solani subsp. cucurbitae TaxID=2747967 RepID=A0ACD3ZG23_FUSSC|nr:hypothetical protein LCI18_010962 [Fusarium solani-melongenae]
MSNESSNDNFPGRSQLTDLGVGCFNAPGYSTTFAKFANLSNAVTVPANATVVHITGQLGMNDEGELVGGPAEQLRQAFLNVEKNLLAAGARHGWNPDLNEERLQIYAGLIKEFCGSNKPSQTSVTVPALWLGAHIEITVEAIVG